MVELKKKTFIIHILKNQNNFYSWKRWAGPLSTMVGLGIVIRSTNFAQSRRPAPEIEISPTIQSL